MVSFGKNLNLGIWSLLGRLVKKGVGEVMPVEWLFKFVEVSEKLSKDSDFKSIFFWISVLSIIKKSLTISAVRMFKTPCAIELNKVLLCL